MLLDLSSRREIWPLASPFRISRGTKIAAEVVVVEIRQSGACGRGESVPYAHYGETVESVLAQVQAIANNLDAGFSRADLSRLMPPGAARNAVDCALWDLSARLSGESVTARLGCGALPALSSALTVSLDTPERMEAAAAAIAGAALIKIKVDGTCPEAQLAAVRRAAPRARLIVDPNESWSLKLLEAMQPALVAARVDLVEQPLPAADDAMLEGFRPACNICADESCHIAEDLPKLQGRFQAVNIKLDKTGGLTAALQLYEAARAQGFQVMVGCMICTSLGIAPAYHIARHADFVDLDGPLWLKQDYAQGVRLERDLLIPPGAGLWGGS
jgi:L-alanine-DL-glutamate epimerase-like enolase superfamily enzyme